MRYILLNDYCVQTLLLAFDLKHRSYFNCCIVRKDLDFEGLIKSELNDIG